MRIFFFTGPATQGLSLIEIAMVFLVSTLALFPVVQMVGKTGNNSHYTSTSEVTKQQSIEVVAGYSLMERALAGEIQTGNTGNTSLFSTQQSLSPGSTWTSPRYLFDASVDIWYQWVIRDVSYRKNSAGDWINVWGDTVNQASEAAIAPSGNRLIQVTLRMYHGNSSSIPTMVVPGYLFQRENSGVIAHGKTGVVFMASTANTMRKSTQSAGFHKVKVNGANLASPWLMDRYHVNTTDPQYLYLYDDSNLDITQSEVVDNPTSRMNEQYLLTTVLGNPCDPLAGNITDYFADAALNHTDPTLQGEIRTKITALCQDKTGWSATQWENLLTSHLSKIEATRSALLSTLVTLEENPWILDTTTIGFGTFSGGAKDRVALEEASPIFDSFTGQDEKRYVNLRDAVSWLNRGDTLTTARTIGVKGKTNLYEAMDKAASMINNSLVPLSQKLVVLICDSDATTGTTDLVLLTQKAAELGSQGITLLCIGLPGAEVTTLQALADATPHGSVVMANTMAEIQPAMDGLTQELQFLALRQVANRFHAGI